MWFDIIGKQEREEGGRLGGRLYPLQTGNTQYAVLHPVFCEISFLFDACMQ